MTPTPKAAQAALRQRLLDVPADLRVWARTEYPETYREILLLEKSTCLLEEMGVQEGYAAMADRLIAHWTDLEAIWEADGAGSWIWSESLQEPVPVCPDCRPAVVMERVGPEAESEDSSEHAEIK